MSSARLDLDDPPTVIPGYAELNRYTQIIIDEAVRRGVAAEVIDPPLGELALRHEGRVVHTLESLSELTSAVAFRRCDHKLLTRTVLERAQLRVPPGRAASFDEADEAFLDEWQDIVVKPARGEQGWGITVGVTNRDELAVALERARAISPEVVLEQRCEGEDLRILVIGREVVAASVRRPPVVVGDGSASVAELIDALSAQRQASTHGASTIPLDEVTASVVGAAGFDLDSVLPSGTELVVRRTANLHTGGTITDVTDDLHPHLADVALAAAAAIDIPVVGLDLIVPDVRGPDHVFIEANEQPGLANHEPRPTVERFVDLLFPETAPRG